MLLVFYVPQLESAYTTHALTVFRAFSITMHSANSRTSANTILILLALGTALAFSLGFIRSLSCYYNSHDIGTNAAANGVYLVGFLWPVIFLVLSSFTIMGVLLCKKYCPPVRNSLLLQIGTMLIIELCALFFLTHYAVKNLQDYPNSTGRTNSVSEFLQTAVHCETF